MVFTKKTPKDNIRTYSPTEIFALLFRDQTNRTFQIGHYGTKKLLETALLPKSRKHSTRSAGRITKEKKHEFYLHLYGDGRAVLFSRNLSGFDCRAIFVDPPHRVFSVNLIYKMMTVFFCAGTKEIAAKYLLTPEL
jgi:hypothetical protein